MINLVELENLSYEKRQLYFERLRSECHNLHASSSPYFWVKMLGWIASIIRKYDFEIQNAGNIPDGEVIFLCNHSNAHDYFTVFELGKKLARKTTTLGGLEGLTFISNIFLRMGNATLFKRDNNESIDYALRAFCCKILNGESGLIFGEATWNIHPTKPMHNIHAGVTEISLITDKPIVPVIFEYVETNKLCKKEADIYKKVIVSFGEPEKVTANKSIFEQTDRLQEKMVSMRKEIWKRENINKTDLSEEEIKRYLNHTYLKKFKALGFKYDSKIESNFLLKKGQTVENEYCLDADGNFVPGITEEM